jgi:transposase-like protein
VPKSKNSDTEVVASSEHDRRQRRRFSAEYKERILREADACTERGALGELLRREGIYSSLLSVWRAQREEQGRVGLAAKRPGPKPSKDVKDRLIEQQNSRIAKLEKELRISKALIDMQVKAHEILGIALPRIDDNSEDDSPSSSNSAPRRFR